jgi:hypothetical protein
MEIEVNHVIPSNLRIKTLDVTGTENENSDKWIRYITRSKAIQISL